MTPPFRKLAIAGCAATLFAASLTAQSLQTLHITVAISDARQQTLPVARFTLLISDDPPSAVPRRVLTNAAGIVEVKLRPGRYTVESDEPAVAGGRAFEWAQSIELSAGTDAALVLDSSNATSIATTDGNRDAGARGDLRTSLLQQWQDSVVEIWTPTAHASGVLLDHAGLIATNAGAIGNADSVAVQLSPTLKVEASVIVRDAKQDVSIMRLDPAFLDGHTPLALGCDATEARVIADSAKLFALSAPLRSAKAVSVGFAQVTAGAGISTDFRLPVGGAGGPVFNDSGSVVGLSTVAEAERVTDRPEIEVIPIQAVCSAVAMAIPAQAVAARNETTPPQTGQRLPVEPAPPLPARVLEEERRRKPGWPQTLQVTTQDFEVSALTPLLLFAERREYGVPGASERTRTGRVPVGATARPAPQRDFANWRDYVEDLPPVLLLRVTPRQVEGFWTTVARGAALTQGIALPPIRHFKPGFARMRLLCDNSPVTPIQPFVIEQRVSDTDAIREGLYVYDPASLAPCRSIAIELFSEKNAAKVDTTVLDRAGLQRVLNDIPRQ